MSQYGDIEVARVVAVHLDAASADYFRKCARIRDVTVRHLLNKMFNVIGNDQLVGAILDDDAVHCTDFKHHQYSNKKYPL